MGTRPNRQVAGAVSEEQLKRFRVGTNTPIEEQSSRSSNSLPTLRFDVKEAALILRMSRAQLYNRLKEGRIKAQKDGARTYVTRAELERYVAECSTEDASAL